METPVAPVFSPSLSPIVTETSLFPFLKSINRLSGALLGLVEGVLAVGLIVYVIAKFAGNAQWLTGSLSASKVAHWLVWASSFLVSLLPEALEKMKSIF